MMCRHPALPWGPSSHFHRVLRHHKSQLLYGFPKGMQLGFSARTQNKGFENKGAIERKGMCFDGSKHAWKLERKSVNVQLAYVLSRRGVSETCFGSVLLNVPIHDLKGEWLVRCQSLLMPPSCRKQKGESRLLRTARGPYKCGHLK